MIQEPPIDIDIVLDQLAKDTRKIGQKTAHLKCVKQPNSASNFEARGFGDFAGIVVIERHYGLTELSCQIDCTKFSRAE